jgi:hypothetical protein
MGETRYRASDNMPGKKDPTDQLGLTGSVRPLDRVFRP